MIRKIKVLHIIFGFQILQLLAIFHVLVFEVWKRVHTLKHYTQGMQFLSTPGELALCKPPF